MTSEARTHTYCAWAACGYCSLRTADVFPVVASLPSLPLRLRAVWVRGEGNYVTFTQRRIYRGSVTKQSFPTIPFLFPGEIMADRLVKIAIGKNNPFHP